MAAQFADSMACSLQTARCSLQTARGFQIAWNMDKSLTEDFLRRVLGPLAFGKRLLVWDSFKCHLSEETKAVLAELRVYNAVVPRGCTKYVQAPDVSWNQSLKAAITRFFEDWMADGSGTELTRGGNPRPPLMGTYLQWVVDAWDGLSPELIRNSFKSCGIKNKTVVEPPGLEPKGCHAEEVMMALEEVAAFGGNGDSDSKDSSEEEMDDGLSVHSIPVPAGLAGGLFLQCFYSIGVVHHCRWTLNSMFASFFFALASLALLLASVYRYFLVRYSV